MSRFLISTKHFWLSSALFVAILLGQPFSADALLQAHQDYDGCSTCHTLHASSGGALFTVGTDSTDLCLSCHGPGGVSTLKVTIHNLSGGDITCGECHNSHNNGQEYGRMNVDGTYNIKLVGLTLDYNNAGSPLSVAAQIREERIATGLGALKDVIYNSAISDYDRADGRGVCNACHGATHNTGQDCSSCHAHDGGFAGEGDCRACHDGSGLPGTAEAVSIHSTHATNTIYNSTGVTFTCENCHTAHESGTIQIPNNNAVGIMYNSSGHNGISFGNSGGGLYNAAGLTEAEICWNCHNDFSPVVSEWGTNSGGSYDYGSLHSSSGDATSSPGNHVNWTTGYWKSANFSYKNGSLDTRPTDGDDTEPSGPGAGTGGDSASIHATGGTVGAQSNTLSEVRCSYCHDVHDTMGASGKPYLRGNWTSNAYPEDGAPQSGDNWTSASPFSAGDNVPRGLNTQNGSGGYQIDQNNSSIDHSSYSYATDDSLCSACHSTNGSSTGFVGTYPLHRNIIPGFNNDGSTSARNIFQRSQRSTANDRLDPWMAYFGITDYYEPAAKRKWMGGFRETSAGTAQIGIDPHVDGQAFAYNDFSWGVSVDNTTIDTDFHSFTCSKCHNPHASRMPRLMISNCLDVQRNTWDDDYKAGATPGNSTWGDWLKLTPSSGSEGYQEIAYANTAQNCHRYFPVQSGTGTGAYEGEGWNSVTPW